MKLVQWLFFGILGLATVQCSSGPKESATAGAAGAPAWAAGMRNMANNLEKLMPYVFSRKEFSDDKNRSTVRGLIGDFAKGVEQVPGHAGEAMLGQDPIIRYSIAQLQTNTRHALDAFNEGQVEFSRNILRQNVGLCFTCHSTQNFGPQNNFTTAGLPSQFRLSVNERADYYVATRQFDRALEILDGVVQSPAAMLENPHEQLNALRKYLFLQVRVKNDPGPAIVLLDKYLSWDRLPYFLAQDARAWQESLKAWQREKARPAAVSAQKLLAKAEAKQGGGYQAGLVDYLRASQLLHESLRGSTAAKDKARIYNQLGRSYETLSEMGLWDLPDVYYEACIRIYPKSPEAQACYRNFERSIILGFSGSAGTMIPPEERKLLAELKELAGFAP